MTTDQLRELAAKKAVDSADPAWNWGFQEGASLFLEPLAVAMDALEATEYSPNVVIKAREALAKIAALLEKP